MRLERLWFTIKFQIGINGHRITTFITIYFELCNYFCLISPLQRYFTREYLILERLQQWRQINTYPYRCLTPQIKHKCFLWLSKLWEMPRSFFQPSEHEFRKTFIQTRLFSILVQIYFSEGEEEKIRWFCRMHEHYLLQPTFASETSIFEYLNVCLEKL